MRPASRRPPPPRSPPPIDEAELGAISPSLMARPAMWRDIVLHPQARERAGSAPWTAWWSLRLGDMADPGDDRAVLEQAHAAFVERLDSLGALLACAAAIDTYHHEQVALESMDGWIARLEALLNPAPTPWPNAECGAEVMACGTALRLRCPTHPLLAAWAELGAREVLHLVPGPSRLRLATFLLHFHVWRGEFGASALVADSLPGTDWSQVRPSDAFAWLFGVAIHARYVGDIARGQAAVRAGLDQLGRGGPGTQAFNLHLTGAALALTGQDATTATTHLEAARTLLDHQSLQDQTHYWYACTGLALLRGEAQAALALARSTLAQAAGIGGPYRAMAFRFALAAALLATGDVATCAEEALATLDEARSVDSKVSVFSLGLLASHALDRCGRRDEADTRLDEALATGAAHDYRVACGGWLPGAVAERMARALALGRQSDYARRFVRRAGLRCPDATLEAWPWPLKLRGFGSLDVERDGEPLAGPGPRVAQRPLDLLRALLAHGGRSLPVRTALDWLWPDAENAQQRKAFDAALGRLRRALGDDSLLQLDGAHLRLDTARCWSDVKALTDTDWSPEAHADDPAALRALGDRLLRLARAPLLDGIDEPWALQARERMRRRLALTIEPIALQLERHAPEQACALYARAVEADPLAESIARRLIAAQLARGERGEALRAWLHCKAMLALHGAEPSATTRALVRQAGLSSF